ncbi:MAG: hypothetical protein WC890_06035 [Candidatus Margulisiibacteriota bacterium]
MSICSRVISGSATLRGVNGKISMIQSGKVSIERICKYIIKLTLLEIFFPHNNIITQRGNKLRQAAMQYVLSHPEFQRDALALLESFESKCFESAGKISLYSPLAAQMAIEQIRGPLPSTTQPCKVCSL